MTITSPARQASKSAAMRAMLDHLNLSVYPPAFITNPHPQRTDHMRLSAKAKAANELAAANAHVAQVRRMNDTLSENNMALMTENAAARDRANICAKAVDARDADIRAFKAEVLALTVANAEMRGYIGRTLEDDAVREVGGEAEPVEELTGYDREHMHKALAADRSARSQPRRSRRTGPFMPNMNVSGGTYDDSLFGATSRVMQATPRPWHDR